MVHIKVNMCRVRAYRNVRKSDMSHAVQYIWRDEKLMREGRSRQKRDLVKCMGNGLGDSRLSRPRSFFQWSLVSQCLGLPGLGQFVSESHCLD